MHALPILLVAAFTTATPTPAEPPRAPENLLAGPARCVLRYLDAVRIAGPHVDAARGRTPPADERAYAAAKRLIAPRALDELERRIARGEDHPLAPWRAAARARVLESFQLLAARRAPLGAAVVTVNERFWAGAADAPADRAISEYLVARVSGEWRVIDRSPGGAIDDATVAETYAGFFDAPREAAPREASGSRLQAAGEAPLAP